MSKQETKTTDKTSQAPAAPALPKFSCVVAMDAVGGIGRKGRLPWGRLQYDSINHYDLTTAISNSKGPEDPRKNLVIMGHTTWKSLPLGKAPMSNRINTVITSSPIFSGPQGVRAHRNLEKALLDAAKLQEEGRADKIFVVGGAKVFQAAFALPECEFVYLTSLLTHVKQCDVFIDPGQYFTPDTSYPRKVHTYDNWQYMIHRLKRRA